MTDGRDVPGSWDPGASGEPPAALLRRAISHVESLLHRLDPLEVPDEEPATQVVEKPVTQLPIGLLEEVAPAVQQRGPGRRLPDEPARARGGSSDARRGKRRAGRGGGRE